MCVPKDVLLIQVDGFLYLKLQVDTYATAVTVHILAHHNYNNFYVSYDEKTKEYTARRKVPRSEPQPSLYAML